MKGLRCTTNNCEYNNAGHCLAGVINISESAVCRTKLKRDFRMINDEFAELEAADEFDYEDNEDVLIQCDATKCLYNRDHMCSADLVTVRDGLIRTKCVTKRVDRQ